MATRNISIRLSLQDQETVKRGLEKLGAEGQAALKKIEAGSAPASKGLLALNDASASLRGSLLGLGVGAAAVGIATLAKRSIDAADAMNDLHIKTGLAFKDLATFDLIARQSGTTLDGVANSVKFLQRYMIEHGDKLKAIGVTATDTNEAMGQFADIIAGVRDPALRTALAMEVLGRQGVDMIPVLMGGSEGLSEAAKAAEGYGAALEKTAPMADEFNDTLAAAGTRVSQFREEVLAQLLPVMNDVLTAFDDGSKSVGGLSDSAVVAADALKITGSVLAYMALGAETAARSFILLGEALSLRLSGEWELANQANIEFGKAIAAASERTNKFIEILNRERPAVEAVTNEVKGGTKAYDAHLAAREAAIKKILEGVEAEKRAAAEAKKRGDALRKQWDDELDYLLKNAQHNAELRKKDAERAALIPDFIQGLERQVELERMTADEKQIALEIDKARKLLGLEINENLDAGVEAQIRANVEQLNGIEAAKKALDEIADTAEKIAGDMSEFLVDGFVNAAEGGKSTFDDMWDAAMAGGKRFLANIAAEILKQKFILPITTSIVGAVPGLFGIQGGQTASGGGGGGGALSTAGNAASILGAATGPSAFLTNSVVNFGLSSGAYGVGTGLSIASAIPYIGAGVAALGILKGLGVIGGGRSVGPNAGAQLIERGGVFAVGPSGADNGGDVSGVVREVSQAVEALNALAQGIGVAQIGDGIASFIDTFKAGGIGNAADLIKDAISKGVIEGLTEAERALISSSSDIGATASRIIENRLLPGQLAAQRLQIEDPAKFARDAAKAERDGMIARLAEIENGAQALADVEFIYQDQLKKINAQFAADLGDTLGEAAAWFTQHQEGLAATQNAIVAEGEALQAEINRLTLSSADLRALERNNIDKSNLALFDRITALNAEAAAQVAANNNAAEIAAEGASLQAEINRLTLSSTELRALERATIHDTNLALFDRITALNDEAAASAAAIQRTAAANDNAASAQRAAAAAQSAAEAALDAQRKAITESYNAALDESRKALDDLVESANRLSSIASLLKNAIPEIPGQEGATRSSGQAALNAALDTARAGGTIDEESLRDALDAVSGPSEQFFGSFLDFQRDFIRTRNIIADLFGVISSQEADANNAVNAAKDAQDRAKAAFQAALDNPGQAAAQSGSSLLVYERFLQQQAQGLFDPAPVSRTPQTLDQAIAASTAEFAGRFADGGIHRGGFRIVGERGPELEFTGPSRIFSNSQSAALLDNGALLAEMKQMRADLTAALVSIATHTGRTANINRKWDGDGLPAERNIAA